MVCFYKTVLDIISKGEGIVIASVLEQTGSTPRGTGAKMIIKKDGSSMGTVGGGMLEKNVQNRAIQILDKEKSALESFSLDPQESAELGMICGGSVTIFLQFLHRDNTVAVTAFQCLAQASSNNRPVWSLIVMEKGGQSYIQKCITKDNACEAAGPDIMPYLTGKRAFFAVEGRYFYIEPAIRICRAFIFGCGHVGLETALVLHRLDLQVIVIDDRDEFANPRRFPMAERIFCQSMASSSLFEKLHIDNNSYIIIMTRGHIFDAEVLEKVLLTDAAYIGMIGSRAKRDQIYKRLLDKGYSEASLKRVYCPVGIPIGSETPAEIAISIAGEIIRVRAGKNP